MVHLQQILMKLVEILLESSPYILLGFLIAGVLHLLLPESLFARIFGRQGLRPLLRAIGLGSLIPVCSCGVVPIGLGAYRRGAGLGTILAFMTAAPVLSPASILLSLKLLGTELTIWQALFTVVGSFTLGLIANRWFQGQQQSAPGKSEFINLDLATAVPACCGGKTRAVRQDSPGLPVVESCCSGHEISSSKPARRKRPFRELFHWLFVDFGPSVSLDMLFGLLFAATVLTFVPTDWIVLLTGSKTIWSLLLVILVALPVYTCSMAAIPMVFSFLVAGMSPGAAVAFIIAGPATNFGELNALRSQISWKVSLYYCLSLLTVAVTAGALIDHVIQPQLTFAPITSSEAGHHHHHPDSTSWLAWTSLLILLSLMLVEIVKRTARWWKQRPASTTSEKRSLHSLETASRS